ncbi:hypothetical protein Xph01_46670 [Micromonospora phaseoli]|nr:hypothetical protein Xph01_46670 [Micromonospora phaseoli]
MLATVGCLPVSSRQVVPPHGDPSPKRPSEPRGGAGAAQAAIQGSRQSPSREPSYGHAADPGNPHRPAVDTQRGVSSACPPTTVRPSGQDDRSDRPAPGRQFGVPLSRDVQTWLEVANRSVSYTASTAKQ